MRPHIQINLRASDESGEDVGELDLGSDDDEGDDGDNHEEGGEQQQGAMGVTCGIFSCSARLCVSARADMSCVCGGCRVPRWRCSGGRTGAAAAAASPPPTRRRARTHHRMRSDVRMYTVFNWV